MVFAQIKNGTVKNTIVVDDESVLSMVQVDLMTNEPYDYVLRVCNLTPQPGIGWSYDGETFTSPPIPTDVEEDT